MSLRQSRNAGMAKDETPNPNPKQSILKDEEEEKEGKGEKISASSFSLFSSNGRLWAFCLTFRLLNSLLVQTYFVPDEHWQALEVAHRISFGYGHLTWEWKEGIRSYLHPFIFALLYKFMAFLHLDTPWFMMKAPRLLQSVFSSVGDVYLYRLSCLIFDECVAQWALFCQLFCWFMFFCINRTLSNSLEAVLTVVGLFYWLSSKASRRKIPNTRRKLALFISALACAIRPTSAITWLYVGFLYLFQTPDKLNFLFLDVIPIGVLVLMFSCLLDRWMYGSWILVPMNFIKFNFLSSGGDYYGTHKWHWYFTEGFPAMLFTFLPFSVYGIYKSKEWRLFGLIAWVLGIYSMLGHKEFRFVLPILPIALIFSGYSIAAISGLSSSDHKRKRQSYIGTHCPSKLQLVIFFLLVTNIPMALYFSFVHQRGSEDVMNFLANKAREGKVRSVLFLMPCHATPYYSSLHYNVPMRFLDCSPSNQKGVLDESDRFMMDPVGFSLDLLSNWPSSSHIVLFDSQERQLKELLMAHNFIEVERFFHAHFKVDRELQASIVVYTAPNE